MMEPFDDDDDFGEIYADVEVPAPTATADIYIEKQQQPPDPNCNGDGGEPPKVNGDENDGVCVGSDSDDDGLHIVLNDDGGGCNGLPPSARVVGYDDVDDDGDGGGGDQLDDRSELVTKNGVKGGYSSRFFNRKHMRTRGLMFVNNMKANASMGMASTLNKGWWNGDACMQSLASSSSYVTRMHSAVNPMGGKCGYGPFLPWYWSIFDVNIEAFPEKPWRVPGADITDYFNFGFNENAWKLYCASLEQLWQTSGETDVTVDESLKLSQEATKEHIDQVVSGSVLSPSSEFELPKGRAIQVEDSIIERQPSMDVRHTRSRDSDVIIQIKLRESSDDCSGPSGCGNSIVMDASLEGEPIVGNNRNILTSSGEFDDVVSEDQLEVLKKSVDSSVQERTGLIRGVDEHEHQDNMDQHSEDAAEVPGGDIKTEEGIAIDTGNADPCWIETELSLGDQELSLTSYTDSDSEATENSVHVDSEKSHSLLRRQSVNSVISLKESLPLYRKNSKSKSFSRKPVNVAYSSRNRGPFRKEWRHQHGRHDRGSNLNRHIENDNDASSIPMSSARDLSRLGHKFIDYDICKERLQRFASRKRRDISYNRETKHSCYSGIEKVNDEQFQTLHTKYSYREEREIFRENTNRYHRKHGYERDYFFEPRSPMADNEERERDWCQADGGYYADDSPSSCWESRQFLPKHSSFPDSARDTHRRRINDKYHFRDRYYDDDFDEYEFEFQNKSYRMSASAEREMESLNNKHEEQFQYTERDWKRSARRDRHCDRPLLVLDNLWSGKREDNYQKYTHHQNSNFRHRQSYTDSVRNYAYGSRVNEKIGVCGRPKHARDNRGSDWSYAYTDAAEDEDFMIDPAEEYQFYRSPTEVLNWTEDEIIWRHHETHATSLHAKVQIDDIKLQQHQLNMPRRSGENCLKSSSKIMGRGKRWQAVPRCRKSVDLVKGEGKSHTSSRVLCNGKLDFVDQGMAKKRRALVGFDESCEEATKSGTPKCESNHENKEWLQNLPDKGHKESSDIEEGQIVTEEPYIEASASRRDVSEGAALTESVKERLSQNENSDQLIGGYDNQRILESLAKMEKRRERFKQPITTKKEPEESLKLNNDSVIDTGEMKRLRPARKRSWIGS